MHSFSYAAPRLRSAEKPFSAMTIASFNTLERASARVACSLK
jgi:hypothetical protein